MIFLARLLVLLLFCMLASLGARAQPAGCTTMTCTGSPISSGFLSVSGNQFVDGLGRAQRLACAEFKGAPNDGTMVAIRNAGLNCVRLDWHDALLGNTRFDDEFNTLSLHSVWQTGDNWGLVATSTPNGRGGSAFGEFGDQWWVNPFNTNTSIGTPVAGGSAPPLYQIQPAGILELGLEPIPAAQQSYVNTQCGCTNLAYYGALLNNQNLNLQTFGYYQVAVAVDKVPGFTFQADIESFPPTATGEIDLNIYTDNSSVQHVFYYVSDSAGTSNRIYTTTSPTFDASIMHLYAWSWTATNLTFFIDGTQVAQMPTPTTGKWSTPMFQYLLTAANYGPGGAPIGVDPTGCTALAPCYAHVDYTRTYSVQPTTGVGCNSTVDLIACSANATSAGLKVVLSHRGNENPTGSCVNRQANGLWFDSGTGSGGSDGCQAGAGNFTYAQFKANTAGLLQQFASNSTVIAYEFDHSPLVNGSLTGTGTGSGNFLVSNGQLLGPNGTAVNLLGVDLYTDNGFGGGGAAFQLPTTMSNTTDCSPLLKSATNSNELGFYPNVAFVRFQSGTLTNGLLPTAAQLQPYITCLTNQHIVVAIDFHDYQFSLSDSPGGHSQQILNTVEAWQNSLAIANAGNPYFWEMTQNEPQDNPGGSYQPMVRALYSAIRNVWMKNTKYYPGDARNNGGNNYTQTAGSSGASCVSSSSGTGPAGTGSNIADGSCSWNFVGAAVAGNTAPILLTTIGGASWSLIDSPTIGDMTNLIFDWHLYSWEWCGGSGCSSDVGTTVTDAAVNQGTSTASGGIGAGNGPLSSGSTVNSKDGLVPVFFGEDGPGPAGNCNLPPDPSWGSIVNSIANGHTRVSTRIAGGGYFYHNPQANQCGFTQGNFDADNPVSLTAAGSTAAAAIAAGNGPVPPSTGGSALPVNWAGGGTSDIQAACSDVFAAVAAVNANVIGLCPGPLNNTTGTTLLSGATKPAGGGNGLPDLSNAIAHPVTGAAGKIGYSIDIYPTNQSTVTPDSPVATVTPIWNAYFGNTAMTVPVMDMETGCSCDGNTGVLADDNAMMLAWTTWANGQASGGPTFTTSQQPISNVWNSWGNFPGVNPDGMLNSDLATLKVGQQNWWSTLLFGTVSPPPPPPPQVTTWNPNDASSGITLTGNNLIATTGSGTGGTSQSVRATTSSSSGKKCWGTTASGTITADWDVGLSSGSYSLTAALGLGGDNTGIGFDPNSSGGTQGIFLNNSRISVGTGASSNGETTMMCEDFGAHKFWATSSAMQSQVGSGHWNNSNTCDPTVASCGLDTSAITCPCFPTYNNFEASSAATLVTMASSLPYALPTGFSAWDAAAVIGRPMGVLIMGANDNQPRPANDNESMRLAINLRSARQ